MQNPSQDQIRSLINLYTKGEIEQAIHQANTLLKEFPNSATLFNIQGALLKAQGQLDLSIDFYKKALVIKPDYAEVYNNLGIVLKEQGKLQKAIETYKKALNIKPDYAEAYTNIGNALMKLGKLDEAIGTYKKALAIKPDYAEAYYNIGNALTVKEKLHEAITAYKKAIDIKPDYRQAYYNMGNALKEQGTLEEAIDAYEKAIDIKPDYAEAYYNIGITLQEQGKPDEAIAAYNKVLSVKPDYVEAHRNLSTLVKYQPDDTQIALVSAMMRRPDLKDGDRCHLHYTIAKMNEDLGDLGAAYENYVTGGKLRQKLLSYNFKQDKLFFDQIKKTAPKLKECTFNEPIKAAINTPIFILGMPRSGTTLVEQIISSHSKVHGAGELPFLNRFGASTGIGDQIICSENILQIRNAYLHQLEKLSKGRRFVTDKMPQNFMFLGLLSKALPEAKIVHLKRDPAATCWSNFKHYFILNGLGYSYNLKDTVNYYKLYVNLMEFWDQQYGEQIYHLDYDKLTLKQESETRKLIEYLELDWEDTCLSPQDNKRNLRTASQQQVRQKVYAGSSQAWHKFEPYLNGVFDELYDL